MSTTRKGLSTNGRILIALAVAAVLLIIFTAQKKPEAKGEPSKLESSAISKYAWREAPGTVYLAYESAGPITNANIEIADPGLVALPVNVKVPYPAEPGVHTTTYQLHRRAKVAFGVPSSSVSDLLIGETHLGHSQIEVAPIFTELLGKFDVD